MRPRLVIAGGSGFLGNVLAEYFAVRGTEIVILTRKPKPRGVPVREVKWDGETPGDWLEELEGARALINLAGISVNCRYHARNRQLMLDSRLNSTRVLGEAIARCAHPPPVWLNSSTATIYNVLRLSRDSKPAGVVADGPPAPREKPGEGAQLDEKIALELSLDELWEILTLLKDNGNVGLFRRLVKKV